MKWGLTWKVSATPGFQFPPSQFKRGLIRCCVSSIDPPLSTSSELVGLRHRHHHLQSLLTLINMTQLEDNTTVNYVMISILIMNESFIMIGSGMFVKSIGHWANVG